ncbi:glycoside hydrolase family 36 protein [Robinsoniella sp. KNHs210]|uniref:glycoside hydrolase family 36 protein n=1 Tax=Robinsoniella sp. KNHs210 TaxID=1469950 RepID=UPI000489B323|nr:glycoside hydrolase family 36 protein [Robinsoniella sp. KNHs210]
MSKKALEFYKNGGRDVTRYISGTTVYEETLQDGYYVGLYWSASGQIHRENITETLPMRGMSQMEFRGIHPVGHRLNSFGLEIDGQSLHNCWRMESQEETVQDGHTLVMVTLKHQLRPIEVKVCTRLDTTDFLTRWLEVTNLGDRPAALSRIAPMSGLLWDVHYTQEYGFLKSLPDSGNPDYPFAVAYLDSYVQSEEGNLKWIDLEEPVTTLENRQRNVFGPPYYYVKNKITGEIFCMALAWSAGFTTSLYYDRVSKMLSFEMGPSGKAPLRVIAPQEKVVSPAIHIGPQHGNVDGCVAEWHRHLRTSVIPQRRGKAGMYTVAGRVVEEPGDWILREIDIAGEMGIEAFVVDAGWYGDHFAGWWDNRGDWFEGDFLPQGGLRGIRDYVHKQGMLFGLWMEPEAIEATSHLYQEHPEYKIHYEPEGVKHFENDADVDLSNPQAAEYVTGYIRSIFERVQPDIFKIDYNTRNFEGAQHPVNGYAENNAWRHFEALYGIFEEMLQKYPDTVFENCASGGGRNDLGMLSRFHYCTQSDFSQMPLSIRCINTMSMFLPPEAICYYHNHIAFAHLQADLDTHLRVCLFAVPIFVGFGAQDADRSVPYFEKSKKYIKLAKGFCREVMENHPTVYHHTPYIGVSSPTDFCVLEYANADKTKGYCGIFKLSEAAPDYQLYLRGIDGAREYEITCHNSGSVLRVPGSELMNQGLRIHLESANTSELILYRTC